MNSNVIINPLIFGCLIYGSVAFAGGFAPVPLGRDPSRAGTASKLHSCCVRSEDENEIKVAQIVIKRVTLLFFMMLDDLVL